MTYALPIPGPDGLRLGGGWARFARARLLRRDGPADTVDADALPPALLDRLTAPRAPWAGLACDRPRIMGILNVTPDSFSDGGRDGDAQAAADRARAMPADLIDVGGESTRPGADPVAAEARVLPVLRALADRPTSIDTRKASVARAAMGAGAVVVNDVSGLSFDPDMAATVAEAGAGLVLMHGPFDPATMQSAPRYGDVVLDVYDWLADRIAQAEAAGLPRARIVADPGIGFGKTYAHNLALLRALPLFHGLGVALMLGVSRKGVIGHVSGERDAMRRMPGTLALTLAAVAGGVQWHRVHDAAQIAQGLALWQAVRGQE